jgi:hypothetical protein
MWMRDRGTPVLERPRRLGTVVRDPPIIDGESNKKNHKKRNGEQAGRHDRVMLAVLSVVALPMQAQERLQDRSSISRAYGLY